METSTNGDSWEDYPDDEERDVNNTEIALKAAQEIREVANTLFKEGKYENALSKYQSECCSEE